MSERPQTRLERWLGTPQQTMADGAGTDPVPDPEFNASVETDLPTGVGRGTFPHDPNDGRTYEPGEPDPVRPEVVHAEPWTEVKPADWTTTGVVEVPANTPMPILVRNPRRHSFVITNEGATVLEVGRTEGQLRGTGGGRPFPAGSAYTGDHSAPVWIISRGAAGKVCADQTLFGALSWD